MAADLNLPTHRIFCRFLPGDRKCRGYLMR